VVTRERGQLLVTTALVIAVILVAIVMVLNGTMYVQNADGGEGSAAANDAELVRTSVTQDLERLTDYTADGQGYADIDRLRNETSNFSSTYQRFAAGGGTGSVTVSFNGSASGDGNVTRLVDDGMWNGNPTTVTLVSQTDARQHDVSAVDFDLNFTAGDLKKWPNKEFTVVVTDTAVPSSGSPARWTLSVYRDNGDQPGAVTIDVTGQQARTYTFDADERIHLDVDDGVVTTEDGTQRVFDFAPGVSPPYGIRLNNTDKFVNGDSASLGLVLSDYTAVTSSDKTSVLNATTEPTYDLRYQSPGFDYTTQVTAPVEAHRVRLLVDDFEDGDLSPWNQVGVGDAAVRERLPGDGDVVHSGDYAVYIENTTNDSAQFNGIERSVATGGFDSVVVSLWTSSDARDGPNRGEDEQLVVEYETASGWAELGTIRHDPDDPVGGHVFKLSGEDVPSDLRLRIRQPDGKSGGTNTWYVDDVVVYGVNES
jgi:hypothetical protein